MKRTRGAALRGVVVVPFILTAPKDCVLLALNAAGPAGWIDAIVESQKQD